MPKKSNVPIRLKKWARQTAQKIIISHINNYVACQKWGTPLIANSPDSPYRHPVPLPTYTDYEKLVRDMEETGELPIVSGGENEKWMLIPTLNVMHGSIFVDGREVWYESRRPEEEDKKEVPNIAYLVVDKNILSDRKKFKSRKNFRKFIEDVRAIFFDVANPLYTKAWVKEEVRNSKTLRQRYKDSGKPEKEVQKWVRTQGRGDREANNPSLRPTPRRILRKELYASERKNFDKKIERLRKMGFWL